MAGVTILIFLMSLVPIPLTYFLNAIPAVREPKIILVLGVTVLSLLFLIPYLQIRKMQRPDPILFVLSLFTFSSVIDLIIALENDGIIDDFIAFYMQEGEPYLKTAYGTMINYWDGIVHYAMYLMILAAISWNQSYHDVGLYWAGSITMSLLVLVPGSIIGKFGVNWAILLNIPYLVIPVWVGYRILTSHEEMTTRKQIEASNKPYCSIWKRPVDLLFVVYFMCAGATDLFRGCAALGCKEEIIQHYLKYYEPYIEDSTSYPKVQMCIYMFYFLPYYACAIYGLVNPNQSWMPSWSLIYAGAAAQGQFSHLGASLHARTPYRLRVPPHSHIRAAVFFINLTLFLVPQVFAFKCNRGLAEQNMEEQKKTH